MLAVPPRIVHEDDVRVRQFCGGAGFLEESLHSLRFAQLFRLRDLQSDLAVQVRIERAIHDAERTFPQLLANLEAADALRGVDVLRIAGVNGSVSRGESTCNGSSIVDAGITVAHFGHVDSFAFNG